MGSCSGGAFSFTNSNCSQLNPVMYTTTILSFNYPMPNINCSITLTCNSGAINVVAKV